MSRKAIKSGVERTRKVDGEGEVASGFMDGEVEDGGHDGS